MHRLHRTGQLNAGLVEGGDLLGNWVPPWWALLARASAPSLPRMLLWPGSQWSRRSQRPAALSWRIPTPLLCTWFDCFSATIVSRKISRNERAVIGPRLTFTFFLRTRAPIAVCDLRAIALTCLRCGDLFCAFLRTKRRSDSCFQSNSGISSFKVFSSPRSLSHGLNVQFQLEPFQFRVSCECPSLSSSAFFLVLAIS